MMWKRLSIFCHLSITILGLSHASGQEKIPVAGITTLYQRNTHADVLIGRILDTDTLDGRGRSSDLKLLSLYVDQVKDADVSRALADKHGFRSFEQVGKTLTLGTNKLAVEGVMLIAEHGEYPISDSGQMVYPKRRLFGEVFKVFE